MSKIDLANIKNIPVNDLKSTLAAIQEEIMIRNDKPKEVVKNDKGKVEITCTTCDSKFVQSSKTKHLKSKKHLKAIEYNDTLKRIAKSKTLLGRTGQY